MLPTSRAKEAEGGQHDEQESRQTLDDTASLHFGEGAYGGLHSSDH
jgi:hypothetical protein